MSAAGDFVEAGHLGGYRRGGDPATCYPALWTWLVRGEHGPRVRSVLDVGCGDGVAVEFFDGLGCDVLGIEGVPQRHPLILVHDYATGPFVMPGRLDFPETYDLAWCCEFVEHVEEEHVGNFLATFRLARLVLMTHAEPGQDGYHHVNCQPRDYWVDALASAGFELDLGLTYSARAYAGANGSPWNHFRRSGLAFVRADGDTAAVPEPGINATGSLPAPARTECSNCHLETMTALSAPGPIPPCPRCGCTGRTMTALTGTLLPPAA